MMLIRYKKILALPIAMSGILTGCLTLPEPAQYTDVNIPILKKEIIVDSTVSEQIVIDTIVNKMNKKTSIVGPYTKKLISRWETNGEVKGIKSTYDIRGVKVEQSKYNNSVINYTYYDTEWDHDSRSKRWGSLYPNKYRGSENELPLDLKITSVGNNKVYTLTSRSQGYTEKNETGLLSKKSPLLRDDLIKDVNERFNNMNNIQIPWHVIYTGEVKLKNNDVTAFANIQRIFKSSYVSTNNKTDSEKSGSFTLKNGQNVSFNLYPYKNTSIAEYKFKYDYLFDGKGSSNFNPKYKKITINNISKEFNR